MSFTAAELAQIEVTVLDRHQKGVTHQSVQSRPLYDALMKGAKTFGSGKENVTMRVSGDFDVEMVGFEHDDEQAYTNPATIKEAKAPWKLMGAGISTTVHELLKYGISITDTAQWGGSSTHSDAEIDALVDILKEKFFQLDEGSARSIAETMWRDGTQDSKAFPGILSFILDAPTTGTTFGIDRANTWWRNRASLAIDSSTAANQNLVNTLQNEWRQLRRYGNPRHNIFAGSTLMDAFEKELRSKGNYTETGWANKGRIDPSIADLAFKGTEIVYEPLLDDLDRAKYMYVLDMNAIKLWKMEGEWDKYHKPSRPAEKYVLYRAKTCVGCVCANKLRTSGVYSIA